MIIFYIPSLVPLVPGGPAYQAVRSILLGNIDDGLQLILKVVFTAAAIAAGFMVTSLLERIVKRFFPSDSSDWSKNKKKQAQKTSLFFILLLQRTATNLVALIVLFQQRLNLEQFYLFVKQLNDCHIVKHLPFDG